MTKTQLIAALKAKGVRESGMGESHPQSFSRRSRRSARIGLSPRERKAYSPRGREYLPFVEGGLANLVNEENAWIKRARELSMPITAGISGTTHRFMNLARMLGVSDLSHARLCMLGFLIPINAHSFHEIMSAAKGFCAYEPGRYDKVRPLTRAELERLAGGPEKLGELCGKPKKDK